MLSVTRGQVIRVIQVTAGEWWYLEDRHGSRGYVPHTYLKSYPAAAQAAAATTVLVHDDGEGKGGETEKGSESKEESES
jgi:hypothetical protein